MDYQTALDYVWGLVNFETTPPATREPYSLDRMRTVLARLGNPQDQVATVHLAGSKGKGSTAAMVEAVLRAAGHRTGFYSSPHLHSPRERIRIDSVMISRQTFIDLLQRVRPALEEVEGVTTFECLTAMGFYHFREREVDVAVIEVGLGGRLDATNLIRRPRVSVITPISYEHTYVLGSTIEEIALEKAGIIKPGVPAVIAHQPEEAYAVFRRVAAERGAPLIPVDRLWEGRRTALSLAGQRFTLTALSSNRPSYAELAVPLLGRHQVQNVVTALATLHVLRECGMNWDEPALRRGLVDVTWSGRIEVVGRRPFVVVDGAHNGASARALRETLDELVDVRAVTWEQLWLVFGVLGDKDVKAIIAPLLPLAAGVVVASPHHPRARPPDVVAAQLQDVLDTSIQRLMTAPSVAEAVAIAQEHVGPAGAVVATGSLSVAAEARAAFDLGWED